MTEYIDKGIAINIIEMTDHTGYSIECVTDITDLAVKAIKEMPTADVVEVVHGKWIPNESDRHHHCSVCMEDALCKEDWQFLDCVEILSGYCPHCGAKMDGKK